MNKGTLSIKTEVIFGDEYIVLDVQEEDGKAKAILTKESAVLLAQTLLKLSWKCGFVIFRDDERTEKGNER